jgi:hypothetical protein
VRFSWSASEQSRDRLEHAIELRSGEPAAVSHDAVDTPQIPDPRQRVRCEDNEVGASADGNGPDVSLAEELG